MADVGKETDTRNPLLQCDQLCGSAAENFRNGVGVCSTNKT